MPRFFTVAETAEILGFSAEKVRTLLHQGKLRGKNHSTGSQRPRWGISQAAIDAFLNPEAAPSLEEPARQKREKVKTGGQSYSTPGGVSYV